MAREQGLFAGPVGDCASAATLLKTDTDEVLVVAGNVRDSPRVSLSEQPHSSTATMPMAAVASIMVANHRLSLITMKAELQHRLLLRPLGAASVISQTFKTPSDVEFGDFQYPNPIDAGARPPLHRRGALPDAPHRHHPRYTPRSGTRISVGSLP